MGSDYYEPHDDDMTQAWISVAELIELREQLVEANVLLLEIWNLEDCLREKEALDDYVKKYDLGRLPEARDGEKSSRNGLVLV